LRVDEGTLFPAFDVAEQNDDHALAPSALQFDAAVHKFRQEIAARTAALLGEGEACRVLNHGRTPRDSGQLLFMTELQIAIVLIILIESTYYC
jgi:hypothetical protein